jgi:thioredoxin reductase (NADPH)
VVGVVGGGDSACQEALTLADSVAEVILLHRGTELSAQETFRRRVEEHERITVRYGTVVEEVLGDETVAGVRVREAAGGESAELELGAVFVYVGLQPNIEAVEGLVALTPDGRIPTNDGATEALGLFAAGILRHGAAGRAAASAGDGAAAALAADRYLGGGVSTRSEADPVAARNGGSHG